MFRLTQLVTLADRAARDDLAAVLRAVGRRARSLLVEPTLEGSFNGGDLLVHASFNAAGDRAAFELEAQAQALLGRPATASIDSVSYSSEADGREPGLRNGIYRVLLLSIEPGTDRDTVARFEAELLAMPRHIAAIRNWRLSRVEQAAGARAWTHVWEQEFADAGGLLDAYMLHPYHWAHIDRWFDPECPERIVDARLCHSFCRVDRSAISSGG